MEKFLVSAATGAMTSLLGKLGTMLTDEYKLLKDVRRDIEYLKEELEAMQAFLLIMADKEEPDHQAKLRADVVRELSYDIEDKIDKFILLVNHESSFKSEGFKEILGKIKTKILDIKTRHKIAKDVKDIKCKVEEIGMRYARYKIDESSMPRNVRVDPRLRAVYKEASELVGIDTPRDELVKLLSDEEDELINQLKVVSIVGTGGLGKTTLARQVYNKLGVNFDCQAFVSISRSPDMTKILSSILSQLRNEDQDHSGATDPELVIHQIRKFLKDKRYLIVIDDIWDAQTWRNLECIFVKSGHGSRVMSTTRNNDIAKLCCSSDLNLVYKIKPLSNDDSAKLFYKRIFAPGERCPLYLKEASEDILKKCGGLPLAINTISSLLATEKTEQEWNRVRSSITSADGKNSDIEAMKYILSLSYFDLPLHLRSCLLYLTLFPEDYEIKKKRLVHRWISEGFIRGKDGEDLVELGDRYFHELINRSLIQPVKVKYNGKTSSCKVHDTVLDFLVYMSKKENFSTVLSNKAKLDCRIRRVSLMGNEDQRIMEELDLSHTRSLGVFMPSKQFPSLVKLDALRVLDLRGCFELENHHVKDIGRLIQLRYLNIDKSNITELPKEIGDLVYLETIIAQSQDDLVLPESVSRLKRLTRLCVSYWTKLPHLIGNMTNLQELGIINPFWQSLNVVEGLGQLANLRKLRLRWYDNGNASYMEKLVSSLCKLDNCNLRSLRVEFAFYGEEEFYEEEADFISDICLPSLNCIQNISLSDGNIRWIAKFLPSFANLQKLDLVGGKIEQQDLEMVASISTLVNFYFSANCDGPMIIRGGFQQLQKCKLYVPSYHLEGFKFEAGAMPNLKELELSVSLYDLKSSGSGFDFGIQHLTSLTIIHVCIHCSQAKARVVLALERALKNMAKAHPNRPALEIRKESERFMSPEE